MWFGLLRGANLFALAGTGGTPVMGKPHALAEERIRYMLAQDPKWDWTTLTRGQLELFVNQSVEAYGAVAGSDNPDLTGFRDHGGKVLILHGLADQLIPPQGTIAYYERVQRTMGGAARTAEFARLFLVPGVDHGFRGAGPSPVGLIQAIVAWVEEGRAPDQLLAESRDNAGNVTRSRPLFPYPRAAKYTGRGSTNDAANFVRQ